jgi:hypothetical protein
LGGSVSWRETHGRKMGSGRRDIKWEGINCALQYPWRRRFSIGRHPETPCVGYRLARIGVMAWMVAMMGEELFH